MNRKAYPEVVPADPNQRNFIRENVVRLRNMKVGQNKRTKGDIKPQTKSLHTKSLMRMGENNSGASKPKQGGRRPSSQKGPTTAPVDLIVTCERGSQTEASGALYQRSPYANVTMRRRYAGHGDGLNSNTSGAASMAKPVAANNAQRHREASNRQHIRALKAGQQVTNRKIHGNAASNEPASKVGSKDMRPGKVQRKADNVEVKSDCPRGHVMLPEEERERTLHLLMDSYKTKVNELNALPVRSDTLKTQRRKMELEEELKKIDEGIKIFQRAKVYVKANA